MVEASPAMSTIATVYRRSIVVPRTGSVYKVISAEAYSKHGMNPHGIIFDELHAQPDRELYDVLTTGQGARRQPLTIAITTAGFDRELGQLLGEQGLRHDLAEQGRAVAAEFTIEANAWRTWEA